MNFDEDSGRSYGFRAHGRLHAHSIAQRIEGGDPFAMHGVECLLTALRDRSPGLYRIELDHTHSQGSEDQHHVFAITPSGEIETGVVDSWYDENDDSGINYHYQSTERCEPKPSAFYDARLAEVEQWTQVSEGGEGAWDCVFPALGEGPPWFQSCVSQSPTCE